MELQPRYCLLLYRCRSTCEKLVGFISYLEMENNVFWQINKVIIQYTCMYTDFGNGNNHHVFPISSSHTEYP